MAIAANRLGQKNKGFKGRISAFDKAAGQTGGVEMIDRLRELGFSEGLRVELLHQSPFGKDPIAISVEGMTVALRRQQANMIIVES